MRGPFKLVTRDPKKMVLQEVQNDALEVGGKSSCWKAGRYCNIVLCLDIYYIYTNGSSIFFVAYVGGHFQKSSLIEKKLGTWNWGEARLSKIEADLQQSLKARVEVENHPRLRQESGQS